jgi:hypothetical protein
MFAFGKEIRDRERARGDVNDALEEERTDASHAPSHPLAIRYLTTTRHGMDFDFATKFYVAQGNTTLLA